MSAKLRLYKDKLEGYKRFYGIVKTIKMVNLAKFRLALGRTKTRDFTLRYTEKMFGVEVDEQAALKAAEKTMLYVPITSNRGSCGALNSNTLKYLETVSGSKSKFMCVHKKSADSVPKLFPKEYLFNVMNDFKAPLHFGYATFVWENATSIPDVEKTQIIFNRFVSAGVQRMACYNVPTFEKWLERMNKAASTEEEKAHYSFANAVLNNEEQFVRDFYDFHCSLATLNALCENELSEYAARVVAVEGQLNNIQTLQSKTLSLYNKTRQGSITAALIEILSAISAMEGNAAKGVRRDAFWSK